MDIYITGKNAKGANQKIQLPVIPEEIETSLDGKFAEYDIYRFGQINVPNGKNLSELGWDSFLPGESRKGMKFVHKWTDPAVLDALLNYWTVHGTVVNVCITGTKINKDMMISQYVSTIKSLKDYYYTILFIDYEKISVSSSKRKRKTTKVKKKKVKVKKGQTLRKLAKKYLGSSKKYKLIYNANKKLIDARNKKERKKHPKKKISKYTIYKGQVLVIPVPSSKSVSNSKVSELKKAMNKDGYSKLKVDKKLTSAMKSAMKKIKIRRGRRGKVVKFVQKIVRTKQDGIYGSKTAAAVKRYQRKHKLTVDGVVDYKTLLKMIGG